jgi:hypothetical protein
MKLFGSNRYGVMARNSVILGSGLRFEVRNQNFWHITPQNVPWLGTDGPSIPLGTS